MSGIGLLALSPICHDKFLIMAVNVIATGLFIPTSDVSTDD